MHILKFLPGYVDCRKNLDLFWKKYIQESYEKKKHFENPALTTKLNFKGWATFSLCVRGHKKVFVRDLGQRRVHRRQRVHSIIKKGKQSVPESRCCVYAYRAKLKS